MREKIIIFVAFLATIPLANWWLSTFGFYQVPILGPVASGVIWIGISFTLRDILQLYAGKKWIPPALVIGTALSYFVADPYIAYASGAAFLFSETLNWAVYTPLSEKRFKTAVALSGAVGGAIDSALFLYIAFGSTTGWWQLTVAKTAIVLATVPLAKEARKHVISRRRISPSQNI